MTTLFNEYEHHITITYDGYPRLIKLLREFRPLIDKVLLNKTKKNPFTKREKLKGRSLLKKLEKEFTVYLKDHPNYKP